MNHYLLSILLGIVEGLTEFLPVSSTAHLRLTESLLGIDLSNGFWKMYSIVIQLGAILCLPIYFRARIGKFVATLPQVLIACACTAGPAFLLTKVIGKHLESLVIMGWSLLIGGIVMWIVDALFGAPRAVGRHQMEEPSLPQAIWIGICQIASAVFPGTSRSMSTIAAGQLAGMSRPSALEFSFFLSFPTMILATGYDLFRTFHPKQGAPLGTMPANGQEWVVLAIGFVISFVVALAVVAWFMNWVRQRGFTPFAIYRIIVGIAVLAWVLKSHGY